MQNRTTPIYKESVGAEVSAPVDYDPFESAADLVATAPSTEPQREIWAAAALGREAALAYNESVCLQLEGPCNVMALQQALHDLVNRHEVLRASFSPDGQTLCLADSIPLDLDVVDAGDNRERLQQLRDHEVTEPFDLLHGPLFRCRIIRMNDSHHAVLITAHHTVCDGWSFGLLLSELAELYNAACNSRTPALEPAPGFLAYADDQAATSDERQREQLVYWRRQLAGANMQLNLPYDFPRPAYRGFAAGYRRHRIPRDVLQRLKTRAAQRGCTAFTAIGAAVSAWLHRITGQDDLILGVPAAGQASEGLNGLVGHCVSLLPIRTRLARDTGFDAHLDAFSNTMADGWENRDCSMGRLVQELSPPRDSAAVPLVQVLLNIDRRIAPLQFEGLAAVFDGTPRHFENFEMFMNAIDDGDGLLIECTYDATLFTDSAIRSRLEELEAFVKRLVESEAPVSCVDLLTESQHARIRALAQGPQRDWLPTTVDALVRVQCESSPASEAVGCGEDVLNYAELADTSAAVQLQLQEYGLGRGDVIGVLLERDATMPAVLLGILRSGAAYLPLDPDAPAERLQWMLEDAAAGLVIFSDRDHAALNAFGGRVIDLETLLLVPSSKDVQEQGKTAPAPEDPAANQISMTRSPNQDSSPLPGDPAYIIYTSGSTGKPKGVVVPHGAVANFLRAMQEMLGVCEDDRFLALTTLTFDIAVLELWLPLVIGARTEIVPRTATRDSDSLLRTIDRVAPTVMQATPATWQLLCGAGWQGNEGLVVLSGGEALSAQLARKLVDNNRAVWNMYGPTETTVWSTLHKVRIEDDPVPIGTPICNTDVYVLDANRQPVPPGVPGELYIGGAGVTLGYLNRPQLNEERFVPDTFGGHANARLYRTGDRVRFLGDGMLEYLGRVDFQIKLRGHRIEPGEIEAALEAHPAVERAVVVVREMGGSDQRLVAYFTSTAAAETEALREHLKQVLPSYMLPQHFVALDVFPLTASGKVDRKALPSPLSAATGTRIAPRTETEQRIAAVWREVLGGMDIGANDNFFDVGGHSLLAARCIMQLREVCGHDIPMASIFEQPVLADLALRLDAIGQAQQEQEVFEI